MVLIISCQGEEQEWANGIAKKKLHVLVEKKHATTCAGKIFCKSREIDGGKNQEISSTFLHFIVCCITELKSSFTFFFNEVKTFLSLQIPPTWKQ